MSTSQSTALVLYSGMDTTSQGETNKKSKKNTFVGLSNQGATCYMNSLLQTLFMTPEFRKAMYTWRYDPEKDGSEKDHCIPLQLQRLFGMLQLSQAASVNTVALTRSFGWEGSEVFQQQDVQELCRVLFDALEESFKGTELASVIDDLYAGEMVDYVKCVDIDYQSERRDKFLDCSLAIQPYGSTRYMHSLTECFEHYLTPEILDGDNKYFAESVGYKVDAIKGLKFSKLPQIMFVQLKRFVYDFTGDHVIQKKINEQVKFPLYLNMNKYISDNTHAAEFEQFLQEKIAELKSGNKPASPAPAYDSDMPELVDYCGQASPEDLAKASSGGGDEFDDVDVSALVEKAGEWVYELFAVLVHAGAINGGHYYVYIKDVESKKWHNFNDSVVSEVSVDDVKEAWGGNVTYKYYNTNVNRLSVANAYMLLYRKVDGSAVCFPTDDMVPDYIVDDIAAIAKAEEERKRLEAERLNRVNVKVFYNGADAMIPSSKTSTYESLLRQIWNHFKLYEDDVFKNVEYADVPFACIRLRLYNQYQMLAQEPYSTTTNLELTLDQMKFAYYRDHIVECKAPHDEWVVYDPLGVSILLYGYNTATDEFDAPQAVRFRQLATIGDMKDKIASWVNYPRESIRLMKIMSYGYADVKAEELINETAQIVRDCRLYDATKLYFEENKTDLASSPCVECYSKSVNMIEIYVNHPAEDSSNTERIRVDRRWNVKQLRSFLGEKFQVSTFRMYRRSVLEAELNGDENQSLLSLGIHHGMTIVTSEGTPLKQGHFLSKVYLFKSKIPTGLIFLHEESQPQTCTDFELVETVPRYEDTDLEASEAMLPTDDDSTDYVKGTTPILVLDDDDVEVAERTSPDLVSEAVDVLEKAAIDVGDLSGDEPEVAFGYRVIDIMPTKEQYKHVMDVVLHADLLVDDLRREIHAGLVENELITAELPLACIRVRQKSHQTIPGGVLVDGYTLKQLDIGMYAGRQLTVEILDKPEHIPKPGTGDVVIYIQKFHRSSWSLSPMRELYLRGDMRVCDIAAQLATLWKIPLKSLRSLIIQAYNEVKVSDLHLLYPKGTRMWMDPTMEDRTVNRVQWFLRDGDMILLQDSSEPLKVLSEEEKKSIQEAAAHASENYTYLWDSTTNGNTASRYKEQGIVIKTIKDRIKEQQEQQEAEVATEAKNAPPSVFDTVDD